MMRGCPYRETGDLCNGVSQASQTLTLVLMQTSSTGDVSKFTQLSRTTTLSLTHPGNHLNSKLHKPDS